MHSYMISGQSAVVVLMLSTQVLPNRVSLPFLFPGHRHVIQEIADFFQYAHDLQVSGGQFNIIHNPVDTEARAQTVRISIFKTLTKLSLICLCLIYPTGQDPPRCSTCKDHGNHFIWVSGAQVFVKYI
ncbi:hypothetical protein BDZ97DRAFT_1066535 [Flammula alnicola]|nr:hypothetical protein BDZ97DRAFT_1066535 [Flammula alnicola]